MRIKKDFFNFIIQYISDYILKNYLSFLEISSRHQFSIISNNTININSNDILLCTTIHNEKKRLPFFLEYYRKLGVNHFLIIDHESNDGTKEYLLGQSDCSVWYVTGPYQPSRAGTVWSNRILNLYANNHWIIRVDPDEFLVYPYSDSRNLSELSEYLETLGKDSLFTPMIDCYADNNTIDFNEGDNLFDKFPYFDGYGYVRTQTGITGGFRKRYFFKKEQSPTLKKFSFVKWKRGYHYISSTHSIYPKKIMSIPDDNIVPTGCLLHYKITGDIKIRAIDALYNKQRFNGGGEYTIFLENNDTNYYIEGLSIKFLNWKSLANYGIILTGLWK